MKNAPKYTPDEDAPLLDSWQRGEILSFESLVWKYLKRIYNLSYLLTGDLECAAEAVLSAFVSAYREIGTLRSTSRFSTWLAGLAIKESRKLLDLKAISIPAKTVATVPGEESAEPPPANLGSPFEGDFFVYIKSLPQELGEVILLHYVRGYSLERTAEILRIRAETLTSRLFEAQEMLAALKQGADTIRTGLSLKREASLPHPEIRRTLPAYLDNAVDENEKDLIRKHLGGCGSCRESLAELEWMVEYLKSVPDVEPPHWLTAEIMTRVRSVEPYEPVRQTRSLSIQSVPFLLGACILTILGIFWYSLDRKVTDKVVGRSPAEPAKNGSRVPAPEKKAYQPLPPLPSSFRISGRGAEPSAGTALPAPPAAQPKASSPVSEVESHSNLSPKPAITAANSKPETAVKKTRPEITPQLPQEWGESLPSVRAVARKPVNQKSRNGEVAVLIGTDNSAGSVKEIELAVTRLGGKITGRAYSSGNDILYTQIESDKFYELMKRLGKIGKIRELPQLPEEVAGTVDLVIRW